MNTVINTHQPERLLNLSGGSFRFDRPNALIFTPSREDVERLLELNTGNRPTKRWHIEKLAAVLREGNWIFDGDPIKVNRLGILVDGQHRLTAMSKTGIFGELMLVLGVHERSFTAYGNQLSRSCADTLALAGILNVKLVKTVYEMIRTGAPLSAHGETSIEQIISWHGRHPLLQEAIKFASVRAFADAKLLPRSFISALHFAGLEHQEAERTAAFLSYVVLEKIERPPSDASRLLRQRLILNLGSKSKLPYRDQWGLLLKAYRTGDEPIKLLRWSKGEALSEPIFSSSCMDGCIFCAPRPTA